MSDETHFSRARAHPYLRPFTPPARVARIVEARLLLRLLDVHERALASAGAEFAALSAGGAAPSCGVHELARIAEAWERLARGRHLVAEGRWALAEWLRAETALAAAGRD
ncbi:MAG: hypothetical protein JWM10_2750 [Myxococcaceae bacterium]|nr:hypothetical protein [Myxococcaceae bacterium]